jgi:hypothetical protein
MKGGSHGLPASYMALQDAEGVLNYQNALAICLRMSETMESESLSREMADLKRAIKRFDH